MALFYKVSEQQVYVISSVLMWSKCFTLKGSNFGAWASARSWSQHPIGCFPGIVEWIHFTTNLHLPVCIWLQFQVPNSLKPENLKYCFHRCTDLPSRWDHSHRSFCRFPFSKIYGRQVVLGSSGFLWNSNLKDAHLAPCLFFQDPGVFFPAFLSVYQFLSVCLSSSFPWLWLFPLGVIDFI